ncbi:MAG TPA: penicillin-binding protein activator LpoB [Polyangiaceae bacterium]|nr:penicillin-binding protein activator LpoB [Polyangiaceae bacterium]
MARLNRLWFLGLAAAALALGACAAPKAVRGEQVEGLDDEAMSTGLDQRDLQQLLHENMEALQASQVVKRWQSESQPALAVLPIRNETTEHVDSALQALASDIETQLSTAGHVRVISLENQADLMAEIQRQSTDGFNAADVARWGRQIGVRYVVTGKIFSTDERQRNERRVQYYFFMQVLEVETSAILFQNKSALTKAII